MSDNLPNVSSEKQEAVEKILEFLPTEVELPVDLPSRGKFYNLIDPSEPVTVRPMTFDDEKVIANIRAGKVNPINLLLSRCVNNIPVADLILIDKIYLLYKIREASYGSDYNAIITCPKCTVQSEVKVDLSKLNVNEVPDDISNPREVELKKIKKIAKVRFPKLNEEHYLALDSDKNSQFWRFVDEIDGCTDKQVISEVIKKLPLADMHTILKEITQMDYGIDSRINFICSECEDESVVEVPLGADFFTES